MWPHLTRRRYAFIGLRLNLLRALIAQLKLNSQHQQVLSMIEQTLGYVAQIIPTTHVQYFRFRQLEDAVKFSESGNSLPH